MDQRARLLEEIRARTLQLMESRRMTARDIAGATPYAPSSVGNFLTGSGRPRFGVAMAVAKAWPEVSKGLRDADWRVLRHGCRRSTEWWQEMARRRGRRSRPR